MVRHRVEIEIDLPEGWEPTGEVRFPVRGDYYYSCATRQILEAFADHTHCSDKEHIIVRKEVSKREVTIRLEIPEEYEATGEYRPPVKGEYYYSPKFREVLTSHATKHHEEFRVILRKKT